MGMRVTMKGAKDDPDKVPEPYPVQPPPTNRRMWLHGPKEHKDCWRVIAVMGRFLESRTWST